MIEPTKLATKIAAKIAKEQPVTYTELEARAVEKGIDLGVFQNAIVIIHRSKVIEVKDVKGELTYTIKAKADPKPELSKPTYAGHWLKYGDPIPFYWPEYDGPTPTYTKQTDEFYREKNRALKRMADSEKFSRV